ncbi:hypothetical protein AB4Z22_08685, partial [Paenibacillus sp. TAF58]
VTVTGNTYATFSGLQAADLTGAGVYEYDAANFGKFNKKELVFTPASAGGEATIKAELIDNSGSTPSTIKSVDSKVKVLPTTESLTYSVNAIKDLYAALDSSLTPAADKKVVIADAVAGQWAFNSKLGRKLEVKAKDKSGDDVKIPGDRVVSASSSDQNVAKAIFDSSNVNVIGNKAGKATITVVYKLVDGTTQDKTLDVNVKTDAVVASTVTADAHNGDLAAGTDFTYKLLPSLKVVDNYGVEYTTTDLVKYADFLGLQYVVTDVVGGTVTVDPSTGKTTIGAGVTEFNIKAIANGKSVTTLVD